MGTQLSSILISHETPIKKFYNKKLVVDAHNQLYQYLSTIRQRDGTLLINSKGKVTSHVSGLFFRTINLLSYGIKLAFVYDGVPPKLKTKEIERRKKIKKEAKKLYEKAAEIKDITLMNKYAKRTSKLTKEMIEESKDLLCAFGIPIILAPSEGEAQAAHMVKKGEFYGLISQDTDALLFGSPKVVKNLTISKKKRYPGSPAYQKVVPEILDLAENMNNLGISQDQLIALGMLVGTDFNVGGIKGIGPKKGLDLVKKYPDNLDKLFTESKWNEFFNTSWTEIFYTIKNMPITDDYTIEWKMPDLEKIKFIMTQKYEFSDERIETSLQKINKKYEQKGLGEFF